MTVHLGVAHRHRGALRFEVDIAVRRRLHCRHERRTGLFTAHPAKLLGSNHDDLAVAMNRDVLGSLAASAPHQLAEARNFWHHSSRRMRRGRRTAPASAILFGHGRAHTLLPGDPEDMNKKSVPESAAALLTLFVLPAAGCGGLLDLGPDPEGRLGMSDGGMSSSPDAATTGAPASPTGTFAPNSGAPGPENPADDSSTAAPEVVASDLDSAANAACGPVAPGLAAFAFVVNDVVQHPMTCPSANWEFSSSTTPTCGGAWTTDHPPASGPPCDSGLDHAFLVNTGEFPVVYFASGGWDSAEYFPGGWVGVRSNEFGSITGTLEPGDKVDITSVYRGGIVTLLGSPAPFSGPDAGQNASDEESIPWPADVRGSEGSCTMFVAEIEVQPSCTAADKVW